MNARKVILLLIAVLSVLALAISATGKSNDNIIIGNADTVRESPTSAEQGLLDSIASAGARVVIEYANTLRRIELPTLSSDLQARLDQVSARVVADHANTIRRSDLPALSAGLQTLLAQASERVVVDKANTTRHGDLPPLSAALQTLLDQVSDRIVFQYANTNRELHLAYPIALVNDHTPPQISQVAADMVGNDVATVTWTTDEFADSVVTYGEQTGQYTHTVSDTLYVKQHAITLTMLIPDITYYYQLQSTDQSNNTCISPEYNFTTQVSVHVYLPLVMRNR